jgi:GTP-binding protein
MIDCGMATKAREVYPKMNESDPPDDLRLHVEFVMSAPHLQGCPPPLGPEIAIAGRSNAGKSSVINRLTGNRHTAKVSKTPGRTQLLNFFERPNGDRLVDLPGYGYAKAERSAQAVWQAAVNEYLSERDSLCAVILVMDIRHPLQPFDLEILQWGHDSELPVHVLLNKADKLKSGARSSTVLTVRKSMERFTHATVQAFSSTTGLGLPELMERLEAFWRMNTLESAE